MTLTRPKFQLRHERQDVGIASATARSRAADVFIAGIYFYDRSPPPIPLLADRPPAGRIASLRFHVIDCDKLALQWRACACLSRLPAPCVLGSDGPLSPPCLTASTTARSPPAWTPFGPGGLKASRDPCRRAAFWLI